MSGGRRAALLFAATMAAVAVAAPSSSSAARIVVPKRTAKKPAKKAAKKPGRLKRFKDGWRKTSIRASIGVRKGFVLVGGVGAGVELVVRSKEEAQGLKARRTAVAFTAGPALVVGGVKLHASPDSKLIPKHAT